MCRTSSVYACIQFFAYHIVLKLCRKGVKPKIVISRVRKCDFLHSAQDRICAYIQCTCIVRRVELSSSANYYVYSFYFVQVLLEYDGPSKSKSVMLPARAYKQAQCEEPFGSIPLKVTLFCKSVSIDIYRLLSYVRLV